MNKNFDPVTQDPPVSGEEYSASVRTFIVNSNGSKVIGSVLTASGEEKHPTVILLNGFPGNDTNADVAHAIRRAGFNVVNFSYRGSWGSEGTYSWNNCIEDAKNVIERFRQDDAKELYRCDPDKILLVGHSMGGFISFLITASDPSIKNAASFAGFNYGLWADFIQDNDEIKAISLERMEESVKLLKGTSSQALLDEMIKYHAEWNLINHVNSLSKKNLLVVAAEYDQLAPIQLHHDPLVNLLQANKTKLTDKIIPTGHSFSDKRIELTREIINWLTNVEFKDE